MFAMVGAIFFVLWLVGVLAFPAAGAAIHVVLAVAAISLVAHFVMRRRTARGGR
jgi:hypothetical protein